MAEPILEVKGLKTYFYTNQRCNKAINGVSMEIKRGKTLCIVGESGCGKSVTATSIMQLLPKLSRIEEGEIIYHSEDGRGDIHIESLERNGKQMRSLRGHDIAMIFQDPMTALNPVMRVGDQIVETISLHMECSRAEAVERSLDMLKMVGIGPERTDYPHQLSGGMKQRVVIAMALACSPALLIADEPTTALDVTIQAQVLEMINDLKNRLKTSVLLITHDLGIVAECCQKVAVMYAGEIVEYGSLGDIFKETSHPYTMGLFRSIPSLTRKEKRLSPIDGLMPDPAKLPEGCCFHPRCPYADDICKKCHPELSDTGNGHKVRCFHLEEAKMAHGEVRTNG